MGVVGVQHHHTRIRRHAREGRDQRGKDRHPKLSKTSIHIHVFLRAEFYQTAVPKSITIDTSG
jgi:hypothetical protein